MIRDNLGTFGTDVAVAQTAGSWFNFTNVIDTSVARDVGMGQPVWLVVVVTDTVETASTAGTLTLRLVSDGTSSISTTVPSIHLVSTAFVTDDEATGAPDLVGGDVAWCVPLPPEGQEPYEQYLGLQYNVATNDTTAGTLTAFLTPDPHGWKAYPDANNSW